MPMRGKGMGILLAVLLVISAAFSITSNRAYMQRYCAIPPYVEEAVDPNIIIVMDYSGSMQLPAHFGCSFSYYYGTRTVVCSGANHIHRTYSPDTVYYGYFDPTKYYRYNHTEDYWEVNPTCNVNPSQERIGSGPDCVSGNLLNWISMSRFDVALKAMTGGKTRSCGSTGSDTCLIPKGAERYVYEDNLDCHFDLYANSPWRNTAEFNDPNYDLRLTVRDHGGNCAIGTFSGRWMRVKIDPSEKVGVLQRNAEVGNYAFFVFSSSGIDEFDRKGEIRFGLDEYRSYADRNAAMADLINRMENELPWGGTPTGEALREVIDYLRQTNSYPYEDNSNYISKGTIKDPFYDTKSLKLSPCIKNAVILVSDGEWNQNVDPNDPAYYMRVKDLRSDLYGNQGALVMTVFAFANSDAGRNSMRTVAAVGSFGDIDGDSRPYTFNCSPSSGSCSFDSRYTSWPRSSCDPNGTWDPTCAEWDKDRDGEPDLYFFASSGDSLARAIEQAIAAVIKYNYSGGSLGILAEQEEKRGFVTTFKGTIIGQAMFYTQKSGVDWIGKTYSYWYYTEDGTLREDTDKNYILNKGRDRILEFTLDINKQLQIKVFNVDSNGNKTGLANTYNDPDQVNYLFEVGKELFGRSYTSRKILIRDPSCSPTPCLKQLNPTSANSDFVASDGGLRLPLLGVPDSCLEKMCSLWASATGGGASLFNQFAECAISATDGDYQALVEWLMGKDTTGFRSRTMKIGADTNTWKLGDIIYSTPVFVQYPDTSVIYVGANDGMLHAFEAGKLTDQGIDPNNGDIVKLITTQPGSELWAFIPTDLIPYLRFLADSQYCHLYYVDLTPYVFKANGRVYLVGGYRLGAAVGLNDPEAVNPPFWSCPSLRSQELVDMCLNSCVAQGVDADTCIQLGNISGNKCYGLSGYFLLDVTDPKNPVLLWEFTHPDLGFSYSGPAIIRKSSQIYLLFGSGPTNINGDSNQKLRFFVVDLEGSRVNNPYIIETSINNGFSGRLFKEGFDYNDDGITDYVFVGYAREDGTSGNWMGGLIMIDVRSDNPAAWSYSRYFGDQQGPVTARVEVDKCFDRPYLFFGSGRWFYKTDNPLPSRQERILGVPLECSASGCSPVTSLSSDPQQVCSAAQRGQILGWYIDLQLGDNNYLKERVITNPAFGNNVAVFISTSPINDACSFGGKSRVWLLNCATGGALGDTCSTYPIAQPQGKVLVPGAGGEIVSINLENVASSGNRSIEFINLLPPETAPVFVGGVQNTNTPESGIILWIEK